MKQYDYIIAGTGAAGLLTAYRMSQDNWFDDKAILLIDKDVKNSNDRTWCYWEEPDGEWDHLLHKTWTSAFFGSAGFSKSFNLAPFLYKMLRSNDLYQFVLQNIKPKPNIDLINDEVTDFDSDDKGVIVNGISGHYRGKYLLSSIPDESKLRSQKKYPYLRQHFIGWFVKCENPVFNDREVRFMDFNIPQLGNTRFMYVLPLTPKEGLVEYTLFSEKLLPETEYEDHIRDYLKKMGAENFTLLEKEKGSIPMTCYPFHHHNSRHILHIGSAGGWTKPSTGYTFRNTSQKTKELMAFLKTGKSLTRFYKRNRFWYFDLVMLEVLYTKNETGSRIFSSIFSKIRVEKIFRFLNEEVSLPDELRIMNTIPRWEFGKATFRAIYKVLFKK